MPHPSKIPAAWLYPIQMISIPSTEAAFEKGWEPGINKYTLYGIHVSSGFYLLLFKPSLGNYKGLLVPLISNTRKSIIFIQIVFFQIFSIF